MSEFAGRRVEVHYGNCFIIPYTTDENYDNAVNRVLKLLKDNVAPESIVLTEGDY